jgi:purine-nucleoside phosphorylase
MPENIRFTNTPTMLIERAASFIASKATVKPRIGMILGSGLGDFTEELTDAVSVPFTNIPEFPRSNVEGHVGAFVFGNYKGIPVVALKGRLHFYEGHTPEEVVRPVRIMKKLGVETIIITNVCGAINPSYKTGDFMLIKDHILFALGANPLVGPNLDEFGPRFVDVADIYTKDLRDRIKAEASQAGIPLQEGVYSMYTGPNYETHAEIRYYGMVGADAVGMSTVPEALAACHCGMKIIGIAYFTNMAPGVSDQKIYHEMVLENAVKARPLFSKLLGIAINIANQ